MRIIWTSKFIKMEFVYQHSSYPQIKSCTWCSRHVCSAARRSTVWSNKWPRHANRDTRVHSRSCTYIWHADRVTIQSAKLRIRHWSLRIEKFNHPGNNMMLLKLHHYLIDYRSSLKHPEKKNISQRTTWNIRKHSQVL